MIFALFEHPRHFKPGIPPETCRGKSFVRTSDKENKNYRDKNISAWARSLSLSVFFFFAKWGKHELHQTIASGREKIVLKILRLRNTKIMKKVFQKQFN